MLPSPRAVKPSGQVSLRSHPIDITDEDEDDEEVVPMASMEEVPVTVEEVVLTAVIDDASAVATAVVLSVNGAKSATSPIRRVALLASGRAQAGRGGPGRAEWST